jgi:hypothetical protein
MSGVDAHEALETPEALDTVGALIDAPAPIADRMVIAWARWYTRDLPGTMGEDRLSELESDLFEQRDAADGDPGVARSILARAIRGIPSDVAWRFALLRQASLGAPRGTFPLALPAFAHLATALLLAWGVLVVVRVAGSMGRGEWAGAWDLVAAGVVGLAMALVGAWLVVVLRRRTLGAFWLAAAAYVLIRFGTDAVVATSLTLTAFQMTSIAQYLLLVRAATIAGVLFFVAMAVWWAAPRETTGTEGSRA